MDFVSKFYPGEYDIIPNGVDIDRFENARPMERFNDGKTNILFLGRMERRKGLKYLVMAYSRLKWRYPDIRLIIAGGGNPGEEVLSLIGERNLQDVEFTGLVPYQDVPRYYQSAHIYCAPNTGRESFGIVLLEAMSAGKPIAASRIDGFSRVLSNGVEGLLVKPKDDAALANALERLIIDGQLRREMGARGAHHGGAVPLGARRGPRSRVLPDAPVAQGAAGRRGMKGLAPRLRGPRQG